MGDVVCVGSNFGVGSVGRNFGLGGMVGVGQKSGMACYLIILYRKHYVFYRTLYNCTNRIHQALQHTYFISCFLIHMEPVCDAFLDLFSNLFSLDFFF